MYSALYPQLDEHPIIFSDQPRRAHLAGHMAHFKNAAIPDAHPEVLSNGEKTLKVGILHTHAKLFEPRLKS